MSRCSDASRCVAMGNVTLARLAVANPILSAGLGSGALAPDGGFMARPHRRRRGRGWYSIAPETARKPESAFGQKQAAAQHVSPGTPSSTHEPWNPSQRQRRRSPGCLASERRSLAGSSEATPSQRPPRHRRPGRAAPLILYRTSHFERDGNSRSYQCGILDRHSDRSVTVR